MDTLFKNNCDCDSVTHRSPKRQIFNKIQRQLNLNAKAINPFKGTNSINFLLKRPQNRTGISISVTFSYTLCTSLLHKKTVSRPHFEGSLHKTDCLMPKNNKV